MTLAEESLQEIIDWLRNEAEERMKRSLSRKDGASSLRNLSAVDLRAAKRNAEQMFGRKLDLVSTTVKENNSYVDMQERIADKLQAQAMQLTAWADTLLSLRESCANEALERAAQRCENLGREKGHTEQSIAMAGKCAILIRAMKGQPLGSDAE